jgi:hypothetical protein
MTMRTYIAVAVEHIAKIDKVNNLQVGAFAFDHYLALWSAPAVVHAGI